MQPKRWLDERFDPLYEKSGMIYSVLAILQSALSNLSRFDPDTDSLATQTVTF
jgi:hypothetical protein